MSWSDLTLITQNILFHCQVKSAPNKIQDVCPYAIATKLIELQYATIYHKSFE